MPARPTAFAAAGASPAAPVVGRALMGLPIGTGGVNRRPFYIRTLKTEQETATPPPAAVHSGALRWQRG